MGLRASLPISIQAVWLSWVLGQPPRGELRLPLRLRPLWCRWGFAVSVVSRFPLNKVAASTGAGIGWHRDKTQFDEVVGVSLLAPSVLRFRRKAAETGDRVSFLVESCWPHRVGAQSSRARL